MKPAYFLIAAVAAAAGWSAGRIFPGAPQMHDAAAGKSTRSQCPMHPWVNSDKPGDCTICGMDLVAVSSGENHAGHAPEGIVMLPPGSPNVLGVQTVVVKKQPLVRTLRVAGTIGEEETRHGVISAPVEGRIDGLAMNHEGQRVTRRQPIATIFSRTLLAAANDYKLALEQGGAPLDQAKRRLEQFGLVWEQIQSIPTRQPDDIYFGILAPLSGTIVKSHVHEGQYVKEGDMLFEVADFTRMWFIFTAYEPDLPFIHEKQSITVRLPSLPGEELKARVDFISPNLDEVTRSARGRVVLENPERRIKNRTYAEGTIEIDAPEVLAVPRSAVLWPGDSARVYVEKVAGVYEQREVKLGRSGDACWEILGGLEEGERVVTSGNMLIDGQAQLNRYASPP